MQIYGVSFDMVGKQPIVLLKTTDGNRFLPIWIGHPEAAAILMKLQGAQTPRPMTHDLLNDMLEQLDAMVALGRSLRDAPDRHEAMKRGLMQQYQARVAAHDCRFTPDEVERLLAMDTELNAQGMGIWLDREAA